MTHLCGMVALIALLWGNNEVALVAVAIGCLFSSAP